MSASITLDCVVLDCRDPYELARFYARVLDSSLGADDGPGDPWVTVRAPGGGCALAFQRDPEHEPATWPSRERAQMQHLDFRVDDFDAAHAHAVECGARVLDDTPANFAVYADPAGHPFCLVRSGP